MPSRFVSVPNVFFELHCAAGIMRLALVITALAGSGSIAQIQAAPITYMLTSAGSGTLGGSSFTNATVMVTLTCDTSGVTAGTGSQAGYLVNSGTATVTVSGVGTATFTDPVEIVSTYNSIFDGVNAVLIGDSVSGTGILLQEGTVFSGYQLGPLGPVTGSGGVASGSSMTPVFPTTAGNFTWAIGQALGTSTFTATQAAAPPVSSSIVIPNANATTAGNGGGTLPSTPISAELQTVFDPSQFPSGPIYITGFAFRARGRPGTV